MINLSQSLLTLTQTFRNNSQIIYQGQLEKNQCWLIGIDSGTKSERIN